LGRYIEGHKTEIIELTKGLIRIPTVNPPGDKYKAMVRFLTNYLCGLKFNVRTVAAPKGMLKRMQIDEKLPRISILAEWHVGARKTVHINGHYDVVPATGNWKTSPFRPTVKNGRLYGRGAQDMKGNIACILFALKAIKASGARPLYNIQLSFTPDEETGGEAGFAYLVKKGYVKADLAIGEGHRNDFATYGNKGMLWFKIKVFGKSCHASEPYKGRNSFEKMLVVANELIKLKERITRRTTRHKTRERREGHPTMVLGGELWGGSKTNIVPDLSVFTIDRRILPEETVERAKQEVLDLIRRLRKRHRDLKVEVKVLATQEPVLSKKDKMFFRDFSTAVKRVVDKPLKFVISPGATDMRFLIKRGVPSIGHSVDGDDTCHCDNEYVKIKGLVDTTKIFALFLTGAKNDTR